jgi:uncharacterized protein (TIGR03066 family)
MSAGGPRLLHRFHEQRCTMKRAFQQKKQPTNRPAVSPTTNGAHRRHRSGHLQQPQAPSIKKPMPDPGGSFSLLHWAVLGLCLLLVGGGTWAFFEFVVWNTLPSQLVGKWVIQGGEQDGATLDFSRSGIMVGRMNHRGTLAIVNARARVEGKTLFITTRNPNTRADETRAQTMKTLTATELVIEDEQGKVFTLRRAIEPPEPAAQ